ncbi:MAG: XRE family transcriptional regulator [Kytococcus sp.]|nr:XRE family transcriptional regulator [Kytococcus sp.]
MSEIEQTVRTRLRGLRTAQSLSLDDLAERSHLSPSTISRIETGKRAISLDVLLPLARALRTDVESLLAEDVDEDVVIRPAPTREGGRTTWMLTKATGSTAAMKVRLEASARAPEQRVHPGHDWFFVLEGRVQLLLGDRTIVVEAGEAAEFETMTPHSFGALDGPAEVIMIFDRDGHRVHRHDGRD